MEPLSALSVASNILQIVDFATKIVSRARNIHASADGVLDENSFLESATTNLSELAVELSKDLSRNLYRKSSTGSTDKQLIKLAHEAASVASSLRAKLDNISRRTDGASRNALDQAFRSVWKQNEISTLCNRLDAIRKQVDTALLVSLMNRTNQSLDFEQTKPSQFDDDEMTRKAEILASLQQSHWTEKDQSMEISKFLLSTVNMDVEERFSNMIMARLYFPDLPDRFETIPRAHQDTFQWLLDDTVDGAEACEWSSFTKWLSNTDRQNLYWITGKPGSGKSTLMKYMFNHNKTTAKLQQWNASRPLVKAGFFFWNSGTAMQMSRMGLLQSILHTVLTKDKGTEAVPHTLLAHDRKIITGDKETIMHIFPHRWQQFVAFGGGRQAFTWSELKQAFETLIATPITPRSFFFAIDGLDEFDGEHGKLIEMILNATKFEHVKICIASRPWLVFRDAFENEPNLLLEQLTRQDIHNYVDSAFTNNTHYARLKKIEPGRASSLINDLASKSEGVFLWCYLVVQNLLEGMSNADRMSDLIRRLDTMPPGLEQLFDRLLRELEPQYFKHACQLLRLVMAKDRIYLIDLWFADDENPDSAMTGQVGFLTLDELRYRQEIMNRRLLSRCKCFLNSPYTGSPDVSRSFSVGYIHRSAREYLQSPQMWATILNATGFDTFDTDHRWANAHMGILKAVELPQFQRFQNVIWCIEYAIRMETLLKDCPLEYLDEVGRVAMQTSSMTTVHYSEVMPIGSMALPEFKTFLDLAVALNLVAYVRIKADQVSRNELIHAAKFKSLDMRKYISMATDHDAMLTLRNRASSRDRRELDNVLKDALGRKSPRHQLWENTKRKFSRKKSTSEPQT